MTKKEFERAKEIQYLINVINDVLDADSKTSAATFKELTSYPEVMKDIRYVLKDKRDKLISEFGKL